MLETNQKAREWAARVALMNSEPVAIECPKCHRRVGATEYDPRQHRCLSCWAEMQETGYNWTPVVWLVALAFCVCVWGLILWGCYTLS